MPEKDVTDLLKAWSAGDEQAAEALVPLVYDELRRLARAYMRRERPGHALQTTALVHEAYLRLVEKQEVAWQDRAHFYAVGAREMRRILVEHARAKNADKRGGGMVAVPLEETHTIEAGNEEQLLELDEALRVLEALDSQQAKVVELRYFGGLTGEEISAVLGISTTTVDRKWRSAKAWLYQRLGKPP